MSSTHTESLHALQVCNHCIFDLLGLAHWSITGPCDMKPSTSTSNSWQITLAILSTCHVLLQCGTNFCSAILEWGICTTNYQKLEKLIRHGDYMHWNVMPEHKKLTKCGKVQAANMAKALKNMCGRPPIRHVISSSMVRARQTAEILMEQFPKHELSIDIELEEGQPSAYSALRFGRVYSKYFVPSNGCEDQTDVLVCHANIIRYLICR